MRDIDELPTFIEAASFAEHAHIRAKDRRLQKAPGILPARRFNHPRLLVFVLFVLFTLVDLFPNYEPVVALAPAMERDEILRLSNPHRLVDGEKIFDGERVLVIRIGRYGGGNLLPGAGRFIERGLPLIDRVFAIELR